MVLPTTLDRKTTKKRNSTDGFSLVELLVALAIMALVVGLVAPRVIGYLSEAKVDTARIQLRNIENALELYFLDVGRYPTAEEGLSALSTRPETGRGWNGPYMKQASGLLDPWGNPYVYAGVGADGALLLSSLGADGVEGGEDVKLH